MEIQKTILAANDFVFDCIIESGLADIKQQTHENLDAGSLSGYEYVKNFASNQRGRIKFDEVTRPTIYAFSTYTNRADFHTRWELTALEAEKTQVKITESQESHGFFQKLNDMVVALILGRAKKKQMLAILNEIERLYITR
ncbi:MAG: DUF3284 domain-containing protein [Streptococcaceae bacterium]|jgi:hypothetical protein|nr:DUF3284 domain-containing protein [Streptococcaceae bacterium]